MASTLQLIPPAAANQDLTGRFMVTARISLPTSRTENVVLSAYPLVSDRTKSDPFPESMVILPGDEAPGGIAFRFLKTHKFFHHDTLYKRIYYAF